MRNLLWGGSFPMWVLAASSVLFAVESSDLEWVKNTQFDFVGRDLDELRELERLSSQVIDGCEVCLDWPETFPHRILVQVSDEGIPQVSRSSVGSVSLKLVQGSKQELQLEWLIRAVLSRFGTWKGIENPPPLWLVNSVLMTGTVEANPQVRTLLLRRLSGQRVPSLAERIQSYDRTTDIGWDYFLYQFLESGGLEPGLFKRRLEQFWENGYDWSQLVVFFRPKYDDLNAAELELLWRTFLGEAFASVPERFLSETDSAAALMSLAKIEVLLNRQPEIITPDTWYLYRNEAVARSRLAEIHRELEVTAVSIHPYYFNACHSLNQVLLAVLESDLSQYQESVRRWNQDMLDAQQLSYETDRLLEKLGP